MLRRASFRNITPRTYVAIYVTPAILLPDITCWAFYVVFILFTPQHAAFIAETRLLLRLRMPLSFSAAIIIIVSLLIPWSLPLSAVMPTARCFSAITPVNGGYLPLILSRHAINTRAISLRCYHVNTAPAMPHTPHIGCHLRYYVICQYASPHITAIISILNQSHHHQ